MGQWFKERVLSRCYLLPPPFCCLLDEASEGPLSFDRLHIHLRGRPRDGDMWEKLLILTRPSRADDVIEGEEDRSPPKQCGTFPPGNGVP